MHVCAARRDPTDRVSPEAEQDVVEIHAWYERARVGLGDSFVRAVDAALRQAADYPQTGFTLHRGIRRVLLRRFPYGVSYAFDDAEVFVLGCFHLRRNPRVWRALGGRRVRLTHNIRVSCPGRRIPIVTLDL